MPHLPVDPVADLAMVVARAEAAGGIAPDDAAHQIAQFLRKHGEA